MATEQLETRRTRTGRHLPSPVAATLPTPGTQVAFLTLPRRLPRSGRDLLDGSAEYAT
ncbi:hypothetical protein [Streptomyces sp. NPDC001568]|uniref:hypothetical protein n=1 Tax=Streptomyces sp. NPDC001568 TaxID=3364588 RepID=UPI0036BB8442